MIDFLKGKNELILRYTPENVREDWLVEPLEKDEPVAISSRTFHVRRSIYLVDFDNRDFSMDAAYHFVAGKLEGDYYRIDKGLLELEFDLFMHRSLEFRRSTFVAERNIQIFRRLHVLGVNELWIGGEQPGALPAEVFEELLGKFPNTWELNRYAAARVSGILREYLPIERDHEEKYQRYMNRRTSPTEDDPRRIFAAYEVDKYSDLIQRIETMLATPEAYNEHQWQEEILRLILFLFPKYVTAFREAPIRDSLAGKDRAIDFLLVDASGYVDGIEIKKPFSDCMVTKNRYRDNHVPMRELNGTVMQLEKYLFHLNRWGQAGEQKLNKRYAAKLPPGLKIKVVNPGGMIIMGRDNDWTPEQRTDFEVIRRKYRHILEIMTYDDLLQRMKTIRDQFSSLGSAADGV